MVEDEFRKMFEAMATALVAMMAAAEWRRHGALMSLQLQVVGLGELMGANPLVNTRGKTIMLITHPDLQLKLNSQQGELVFHGDKWTWTPIDGTPRGIKSEPKHIELAILAFFAERLPDATKATGTEGE